MRQRDLRWCAWRAFYAVRFTVSSLGVVAARLGWYVNAFDGEEP